MFSTKLKLIPHFGCIRCLKFRPNYDSSSGHFPAFRLFQTFRHRGCVLPLCNKFDNMSFQVSSKDSAQILLAMKTNNRKYCESLKQKCWHCCEPLRVSDFCCAACGALQENDPSTTYFELLGLPTRFEVDADALSAKYKKMQMIFHPDRFVNKSEKEIQISANYSALLNKAYSTLKDPLDRGLYLLSLKKYPASGKDSRLEHEFLMDVMEKNEEIEKAKDITSLERINKQVDEQLKVYTKVIRHAFADDDFSTAKNALARMKYFSNMSEKIKDKRLEFQTAC